jgi:pimeloyl-ACP methyl ester carboxylesterase
MGKRNSNPLFVAVFVCMLCAPAFAAVAPYQDPGTSAQAVKSPDCDKPQDHFVTVKGRRVHYLEAGAGPTIVLIHGNAGNVDDFSYRAIRVLCTDYKIVAVDRPGHGKSDRLNEKPEQLESQAALLHETLTSLGIKRPILIGHSWGASLALAYAVHYQDDIASMVLLAPAAYAEKEESWWWMSTFVKPPVIGDVTLGLGRLFFAKSMLKKELKHAFYPQDVPEDYLKSATASWLGHKQLRAYLEDEWKLNESLKKLSHHYSEIHVPVVIVTGDADKICPPQENAYPLKAAIRNSQLVELKHMGHEIPQTDPTSIRNALTLAATATARNQSGQTERPTH